MEPNSTLSIAAESSPIATQTKACLQLFERISDLFAPIDDPIHGITRMQVLDNYGQFRVWASNIGALQLRNVTSSLDYRLREAPKFSAEVVFLLEDLAETLEDVHAIASGEKENRSGSPILLELENLNDDSGEYPRTSDPSKAPSIGVDEHDEEIGGGLEPISEIQELYQSIPDIISRLFKLSVLVRNSSSRDRHAKALAAGSKAPVDPSYDIDHVQNKFPRLREKEMEWLATRLGKAITQRRQYLWYCRDHREKMAKAAETAALGTQEEQGVGAKRTAPLNVHGKQPLEATDDVKSQISKQPSTLAPTTASTVIPNQLENTLEGLDEEPNDEDNRSITSYASSVGENEGNNSLFVIQFEEVAKPNVPFECPYCWTIQRFNGHHAWKKHVMADLRPYLCTAEACDMKIFTDTRTWFTHELQNHLVEWLCCFCSRAPFATQAKFQSHVLNSHGRELDEHQLASLSRMCQKPLDQLLPSACRICDTWEGTLRALNKYIPPDEALAVTPQQFRRHLGGHMEQLALFAIPRGYREDGDGGSGNAAQGDLSNACSDRSFTANNDSFEYEIGYIAGTCDARRMALFFKERGDEIIMTEEVVKAAAGNEEHGEEMMQLLLDQRGDKIAITEEVVEAAAANEGSGKDIMALLLDRRGEEIAIVKLLLEKGADIEAGHKYGDTPLLKAVGNGHDAIVKLLLEQGAYIEAGNKYGCTPLLEAAGNGHDAIVKLLLEKGADIEGKGRNLDTPLIRAAGNGHLAIVELLLEKGADIDANDNMGRTPLLMATARKYNSIAKLLLEKGANPNLGDKYGSTPLSLTKEGGQESIFKLLLETGKVDINSMNTAGKTLLPWAALNEHENIVKHLLDTDKVYIDSKDAEGRTPLAWASQSGNRNIVKLFLATDKVDVNTRDTIGRTPLSWAIKKGYVDIVELLLATGKVDVDSKDAEACVPLVWASERGYTNIVKLILATDKFDVNTKDVSGQTPLSRASENGHESVVELLLATGKVDVDSKDVGGRTPLWWASENGHESVVELLLATGKVDVNLKDTRGWTALSQATERGHEGIVKLLELAK